MIEVVSPLVFQPFMERIGEWLPFAKDTYLRKLIQYSLGGTDWERVVSNPHEFTVSVAPCGGPIAAFGSNGLGNAVSVFTASGRLLKEFHCPSELGGVSLCGWTKEEALVAVTTKLAVIVFELSAPPSVSSSVCGPSSTIRLRKEQQGKASYCCGVVRPGGTLVVLGEEDGSAVLECVITDERREPQRCTVPLRCRGVQPTTVEFLPHDQTEEDENIAYVGTAADKKTKHGTLLFVNISNDDVVDAKAKLPGGVTALALSPNNEQLAVLCGTGAVCLCSTSLGSLEVLVDLGVPVAPKWLHWCGARFISVTYHEGQLTDDPDGQHPYFSLVLPLDTASSQVLHERISWDNDGSGWCSIAQEVDGLRIVTDTNYIFLEDVPQSLVQLCQLKPTSNVGKFAAAFREMSSGSVNGLTSIRDLVIRMKSGFESDVIEVLLDAASAEFSPSQQQKILACAADAKSRYPAFDAERYVDVVRRLRVVNALRDAKCALPISLRQYQYLSGSEHLRTLSSSEIQVLLDRLINRRDYQLAFDVSSAMKMKSQKVLVQWACSLVQNRALDDNRVAQAVSSVLSRQAGASFVEAARMASAVGRQALAIQLLRYESRAQQLVLLLMQMGQEDLALQKAFEADEVDLVVMVLVKLVAQRSEQQVINILSTNFGAQQMILYGACELEGWWRILSRFYVDARKDHLAGYEVLRKLLQGDRDSGKRWKHEVQTQSAQAAPAVNTAADAEENATDDDYDELEQLRIGSDEEDNPKKQKKENFGSAVLGLFGSKDKKKNESKKQDKPAAEGRSADSDYARELPSKVNISGLPSKRSVVGTPLIETDDMIDLCRYFVPSGAYELEGRWCRNHVALLEEQRKLAESTGDESFMNQSVTKTIEMCFAHDKDSTADTLRTKFGVNEKKFAFAKLRALCAARRWADVDKMFGAGGGARAKSFKSCIGFLPIVEILFRHERETQATQFVPRLNDVCVRVEWYVKLNNFQAAIDDAYQEESPELIQQILKKAQNASVIEYGQRKLKELQ